MSPSTHRSVVAADPIQVLILHADNSYEIRTIEQDIDTLQAIVGGNVESITTDRCTFWFHEESKIVELPFNEMATYMWWIIQPELVNQDSLRGTVFVTGHADDLGASTSIDLSILDWHRKLNERREHIVKGQGNGEPPSL